MRDCALFREHLRKDHNTQIGSLADDIEVFRRPVISPYGECNLCLAKTSNIKRHVSRHLRQIALFAIPRADYSTGDDAGDKSTQAIHYSAASMSTSSWSDAESSVFLGGESPDSEMPNEPISPSTFEASEEPPPTTNDSDWEGVGTYGVLHARDGRSDAPPDSLPKVVQDDPHVSAQHIGQCSIQSTLLKHSILACSSSNRTNDARQSDQGS